MRDEKIIPQLPLTIHSTNNTHIVNILSKLVSFDTTTINDTLDAVLWIKEYLENYGLDARLIYNPSMTRASLIASFSGDNTVKNTIFCGHLDVVPADKNAWETNPFTLTQKDNKLYGRGTADMKGGIAVLLSLVPSFVQQKKNFTIILTHDEETTGNGIREVLNTPDIQTFLKKARGCIVMEPTHSCLVLGHKTVTDGMITIKGKPAHSSNPKLAVNALFYAVEIYKKFYSLANNLIHETDRDFQIPYSVADILMFNAGHAINVMPSKACLAYSCRFISEKLEQEFLSNLKKEIHFYIDKIEGLSVNIDNESHLPALETSTNNPFVQELSKIFTFAQYKKVSFGTEAGHFSLLGIPTVVCGPGSIENAHQDNEFITEEQLLYYAKQLNRFFLT